MYCQLSQFFRKGSLASSFGENCTYFVELWEWSPPQNRATDGASGFFFFLIFSRGNHQSSVDRSRGWFFLWQPSAESETGSEIPVANSKLGTYRARKDNPEVKGTIWCIYGVLIGVLASHR